MRARSASPFIGAGFYGSGAYHASSDGHNLFQRSRSVEPGRSSYCYLLGHLRSSTPYVPYGTYDYDVYDRYTERIGRRTPIYFGSARKTYFTPSYWYHRVPHTTYYPYGGWSTRSPSFYLKSASVGSHYPFYGPSDNHIWRYADSLERVGALSAKFRQLDYERALRNLRFRSPRTYEFYNTARDDVEMDVRYRTMLLNKSDNPRGYYGQSYIRHEKVKADSVKNRYKYLIKRADQKPACWKAEDQVETGYDLRDINSETLHSILNTSHLAEHSRVEMLMDKAGVIPRLEKLKTEYANTKSTADNSKRLIHNLKKLKDETFARLSEPWKYGQYVI
ncbi:hypothetical protein ACOME3_008587 [Neoechinorhynchus agilis]